MFRRPVLTIVLMLLAAPACANGAMGLVYGTFSWGYWLAYVVLTVFFEAAVLGRWANIGFGQAMNVSIGANVLTGVFGTIFSGVFGYMVYGVGGKSYVEPNPLIQTVFCLVVGGFISALIETTFWTKAAGSSAMRMSLLVHLAGVPIALLILLLPARPYEGLEGQANFRRHFVRMQVARVLGESIQKQETKPFLAPKSWDELLSRVESGHKYSPDIMKVSGYQTHFLRFDTVEAFREPCEFNPVLLGKDLRHLEKPVWLVRWGHRRWPEGIVIRTDGDAEYAANIEGWLQLHKY